MFYVPGEHDTASADGVLYRERFGKDTVGDGRYSFTHKSVHFIGLNNSRQIDALGTPGPKQLSWLKRDLSYQKRFVSVTVLNGHIHQVVQKVE
jgi:hypothetical protein